MISVFGKEILKYTYKDKALIIYNYNSLLSFIPILSYLYDNNIDDKGFKKPSYKTVIILIFAILYYVYFKILHPPSGLYVGYNIIKLDKNKKHTIEVIVDRLKINDTSMVRIVDSVEKGLKLADGIVNVKVGNKITKIVKN